MERKKHFSIAELVVVATVILCLVSVLVPVTMRGLLHSQSSRCSDNLRELSTLTQVYLDQHDNILPAYEDGWLAAIKAGADPDLEPDGILRCPSQNFVSYGDGIPPAQWWRGSNYGINQHIASSLRGRDGALPHWAQANVNKIQSTELKLLMADAVGGNYFGIKGRDPVVAGISPSGKYPVDGIPPNPASPLPCMRHVGGSANFLFLAGNVASQTDWPEFMLGRGTEGFAFWHAEHVYPGLPQAQPNPSKPSPPAGAGEGTGPTSTP